MKRKALARGRGVSAASAAQKTSSVSVSVLEVPPAGRFGPSAVTPARARTRAHLRLLERRAERRRPLETDVAVRHLADDGTPLEEAMVLCSTNVSATGIFLRSDLVLPQGELIDLAFHLPSGRMVTVQGEVARVELDPARPSGMGVAFRGVDQATRRALKLYAD